ncbi:MAG: DNA-directed RNA polymerase subunit omega [Candidatus Omnitrophica bacterium]|nr:DNA-directed RNA polymerase subunit omega [Candidatus Omnitrophota bacterium]
MGEIPIEELLPKANGSVYRLVRLAANRALELAEGKPSLIEAKSIEKISTIVLNEIAQGKVVSPEYAQRNPEAKPEK